MADSYEAPVLIESYDSWRLTYLDRCEEVMLEAATPEAPHWTDRQVVGRE